MNILDFYFLDTSLESIPSDPTGLEKLSPFFSEMSSYPNSALDLIQHLEIYISDKRSESNRRKAFQLFSLALANSKITFKDVSDAKDESAEKSPGQKKQFLFYFFRKLEVDTVLALDILEVIKKAKKHLLSSAEFDEWTLQFLEQGRFNTQDFKREVRSVIFGFLVEAMENKLDESERLSLADSSRILKICLGHCLNEKDARNLLTVFSLFGQLTRVSPKEAILPSVDQMSENLLRYFPITFDNATHLKIKVSGDSLKEQYLRIFANEFFYEHLLAEALVKLKGDEEDAEGVWQNLALFFEKMHEYCSQNE